jgi:hypothetical protein
MLAAALEAAAHAPGANEFQRNQATAGLELLRAMVDDARQVYKDSRFAVSKDFSRHTPAALGRLLPTWDQGLLQAEAALRAASPPTFQRYAGDVVENMGGMGIWSWNPNLWGKTPEEAVAYEKARAEAAVEQAKGDAAVDQIDPSLVSTASHGLQSVINSTASTANMVMLLAIVGIAGAGYLVYRETTKPSGLVRRAAEKHFL